jgi:predicted RNA-binding protein YlxR (DUF448 family)
VSPSSDPVRTCIACRARRQQRELVRFVICKGVVTAGRGPGRGAYTCRSRACLEAAMERNLFTRRLRAPAAIPPDLAERVLGSPDPAGW